ncbi:MAG: beta-L-arabinofuranosidase domain-containing protein [Rikenellaceae bacterium]
MFKIKREIILPLACIVSSCTAVAQEQIVPVAFNEVELTDGFWYDRVNNAIDVAIPFALENGASAVTRLRQCAAYLSGEETDLPEPHRFISSDLYKIMEAASYSLMLQPDKELERELDDIIALIGGAMEDDGYLYISHSCGNFHVREMGDKPYSYVVHSHELYNVGHMYEGAVAYYQATGKREWLDLAIKSAQHVNRVFFVGDPNYNDGKPINQAPGHQEIELALCKLYRVTGDRLYLDMAKKFLDIRGVTYIPEGDGTMAPTYAQQHAPVSEQTEAVGHAVRAGYLYTAMAQVDALTGRNDYDKALRSIWENLTTTRMHITGGLGAVQSMEGFGAPYDLPNLIAYNETCAAVSNVFFNNSMFLESGDAQFWDIAELSLFNNSLAGINLEGNRFFYVNPLEANGIRKFNHGVAGRSEWFGCACCPPNILRLILQVGGYMYSHSDDAIYFTLYGSSDTNIKLKNTEVAISQKSNYPFDGNISIAINPKDKSRFEVKLRIPTWTSDDTFVPGGLYKYKQSNSERPTLLVNGKSVDYNIESGFAVVDRVWRQGDVVEFTLPMPFKYVESIPEVTANIGSTAVVRGPLVYCAEEIDNNSAIQRLYLADSLNIAGESRVVDSGLLEGITEIAIPGVKITESGNNELQDIVLIPYYAWSNRGDDESMMVWLNNSSVKAKQDVDTKRYLKNVDFIKTSSAQNRADVTIESICDGGVVERSMEHGNALKKWISAMGNNSESVEVYLKTTRSIGAIQVYWIEEETNSKGFKLPQSWSVEYRKDGVWRPMELYVTDAYEVKPDKYNVVHPAVEFECDAFRVNIEPQ